MTKRKYSPGPEMEAIERLMKRRDELIQTLIVVKSRINPYHCADCKQTIAFIDRKISNNQEARNNG